MITVVIKQPFKKFVTKEIIEETAQTTLSLNAQVVDQNISVVIADDKFIQRLNLEYMGEDKPTDVLSFTSNEPDPETGLINLGDIIISYPTAVVHAADAGNDVKSEIQLLVVHGVLHLLGNDHHNEKEKTAMWQKQSQALSKLNVQINQIYGDEDNS
jgi:probable rRNA maturation factor